MDKVLKIISLKDRQTDFNYWQSKPIVDRYNAIEQLRLQYINLKGNVDTRLQRICRITNKASSSGQTH